MIELLRPLQESDLSLILSWRNAPVVRQAMYSQQEISMEEHQAWFQHMQSDDSKQWFLYLCPDDVLSGVVYFTELNAIQASAFWGFYANPEATPGTGMRMVLDALDQAFDELGVQKLNADVLTSNPRSLEMHKRVGFSEEGCFREQFFNGEQRIDVIRLGMLANEWPKFRIALQARVAELDELAARRKVTLPPSKYSIVILSDTNSWINPAVSDLIMDWNELGYTVHRAHNTHDLPTADFCFCLSFGQMVSQEVRELFRHTLVVHESDLPIGKGWSPLTWQILEGKNHIPVTLLEAADQVDSGPIYAQRWLEFTGTELIDDLREGQADATLDLCRWFVDHYPQSARQAKEQHGSESFYSRRRPENSEIDLNKSIAQQFNLLRVVDNERYPAFFEWQGSRYNLRITDSEIA